MNDAEIIKRIDQIESIELASEDAADAANEAATLILEFATTADRLEWIVDRYCASPAIQIVQGLLAALARCKLQTSLLREWSKLIPSIRISWKRAPEMMSTALSSIDGGLRALYKIGAPPETDFSMLPSLIEDALRIETLPRLRDDIFLGAIGVVDTLLRQDLLTRVYPYDKQADLILRIVPAIAWLEAQGQFYEDEAARAKGLVRELREN